MDLPKKKWHVVMELESDSCIGATKELLQSYIEYQLRLKVSKFQPLVMSSILINEKVGDA